MTKPFGFPNKEKLKSRKAIESLFASGHRFSVFPVMVWYKMAKHETGGSLHVGVSCSKKHFKKAVDRNRVKRLLREAYRLQKAELVEAVDNNSVKLEVFFVFIDKTLPTFPTIQASMKKCLASLQKKANECTV